MRFRGVFIAAVALLASMYATAFPAFVRAGIEDCVDVALVLAVDGSGSIDDNEFELQRYGIIHALRDPDVLHAMERAGVVAVAVLFWGDAQWPVQETEFFRIGQPADVERLTRAVEGMPRQVRGTTGLSMGLSASLDKLETLRCMNRSVINVSGDGSNTVMPRSTRVIKPLREVRLRAAAADVTINALVIKDVEEDLTRYFQALVIVGSDAFVMEIDGFSDFAEALRRKLIREIAPIAVTQKYSAIKPKTHVVQ